MGAAELVGVSQTFAGIGSSTTASITGSRGGGGGAAGRAGSGLATGAGFGIEALLAVGG